MQVTEVKLYPSKKLDSLVKAFGKATIDNKLVLDVLIMDKGDNSGPWATFPNGKTGTDGKYYLPVFWKDREDDTAFKAKVVEAYNSQIGAGSSPAPSGSPVPEKGSENLPF